MRLWSSCPTISATSVHPQSAARVSRCIQVRSLCQMYCAMGPAEPSLFYFLLRQTLRQYVFAIRYRVLLVLCQCRTGRFKSVRQLLGHRSWRSVGAREFRRGTAGVARQITESSPLSSLRSIRPARRCGNAKRKTSRKTSVLNKTFKIDHWKE